MELKEGFVRKCGVNDPPKSNMPPPPPKPQTSVAPVKKLTQKQLISCLRHIPRASGEARIIYKCAHCGQIQMHDYIPYGSGFGKWFNMCHCNAVSGNGGWWIQNAKIIKNVRIYKK
jgi:hypothetical protein